MSKFRVSEDIVTVSELKAQASECLRRVAASGSPLVITQNGKPAGVLLSAAAFDELSERRQLLAAIEEGMAHEREGRFYSTEEVFDALEEDIDAVEASSPKRHS